MWRSCVGDAARAAPVPTTAYAGRRALRMRARVRAAGGSAASSRASAPLVDRDGGSDATPCDASVRAEVDGLAAGADERQLRDHGRRARARHRRRRHVHRRRLLRDGEMRTAKVPTARAAGGVGRRRGAGGRRRRRRALHARDDGRDERAARAQGRAHGVRRDRRLRASAPPAAAEPRPSLPALRRPSRAARAARALLRRARSGSGPDGVLEPARPRLAAGARRRGGRGLPAALVPRPVARARGRGRAAAPAARRARRRVARDRAGVSRVRARVDDRGRRLPRPGVSPRTCARSRSACADAGLPEPLVMRSSGGVASVDEAAAHPAWALVSGPGRGRRRRGARRRGWPGFDERDLVRHGRHLDRRLPDRRRRRRARSTERGVGGLPGPAPDGRPAHRRRRRRLDRLARRRRRAARRAGERRRGSRAGLLRPRRDAADRDRREPAARTAAGPSLPAGSSSIARPRSVRSTASTRPR